MPDPYIPPVLIILSIAFVWLIIYIFALRRELREQRDLSHEIDHDRASAVKRAKHAEAQWSLWQERAFRQRARRRQAEKGQARMLRMVEAVVSRDEMEEK